MGSSDEEEEEEEDIFIRWSFTPDPYFILFIDVANVRVKTQEKGQEDEDEDGRQKCTLKRKSENVSSSHAHWIGICRSHPNVDLTFKLTTYNNTYRIREHDFDCFYRYGLQFMFTYLFD